jgi:hypothetical protein
MFSLLCYRMQADGWPAGSVRSTVSTAAGRASPVNSDTSSHKSAASRSAAKPQNGNVSSGPSPSVSKKKKATKKRKMSASFTFLLACGLQIDVALFGAAALPSTGNGGSVRLYGDQNSVGSVRSAKGGATSGGGGSSSNGHVHSNGVGGYIDVRF